MKKKIFVTIMVAVMLLFVVSSSFVSFSQVKPSVSLQQAATPTPIGQITIPSFKIQLYVAGPNPLANEKDSKNHIAGFFTGLFHGIISPGTLLVSFFNADVQMYEVHNNGNLYNLGFLLGVAIVFVVLGAIVGSRRR